MRLPKWAVPVGGAIVVAGALWSRHVNEIKEREKAHEEALANEQASIRITAKLSDQCSAPDKPIRVTVKNTTPRTMKSVSFHLGVYEEGRVGDLGPGSADEQWITVLRPGAEESRCSAASVAVGPGQLLKAERRGTNKATFFAKGEHIPPAIPDASPEAGAPRGP